jgi:hypothetical protein
MFQKPFRKKLMKHGWLEAAKEGGNESQSWRRAKNNVITAISDMILLYQKLPQDKRNELFKLQNFKDFFDILLLYEKPQNLVKLDIANYLITKSIYLFQIEHSLQNKNTQVLASVINDYLKKALEICNDIIYKEKLSRIDIKIPKEELRYLCRWSEIVTREKNELGFFLADVMDLIMDKIDLTMSYDKKEIYGNCIGAYNEGSYDLRLTLNHSKDKANLIISNEKGLNEIQQFTVKTKDDDYLLYYGKLEIDKKKDKGIILE